MVELVSSVEGHLDGLLNPCSLPPDVQSYGNETGTSHAALHLQTGLNDSPRVISIVILFAKFNHTQLRELRESAKSFSKWTVGDSERDYLKKRDHMTKSKAIEIDLVSSLPRYHCARTELITLNLICHSTHQLLRSSGDDSGPDLSFDKSASPKHLFSLAVLVWQGHLSYLFRPDVPRETIPHHVPQSSICQASLSVLDLHVPCVINVLHMRTWLACDPHVFLATCHELKLSFLLSAAAYFALDSSPSNDDLNDMIIKYKIPRDLHPRLPSEEFVMSELPDDAIGIYHRMFDFSGARIPFSSFLLALTKHYKVHFSQLDPLGLNKVITFQVLCRSLQIEPKAIPDSMVWRHLSAVIEDPRPAAGSFSMADVHRLSVHVIKLRVMPEGVLVLSRLSRVWKIRVYDLVLYGADRNVMGIHDFLYLHEWTGAEVQEKPHLDIRPTLQRLPFYCTPPAAADAVISDPNLEDLTMGIPSAKILAKAEASQKRNASTSGATIEANVSRWATRQPGYGRISATTLLYRIPGTTVIAELSHDDDLFTGTVCEPTEGDSFSETFSQIILAMSERALAGYHANLLRELEISASSMTRSRIWSESFLLLMSLAEFRVNSFSYGCQRLPLVAQTDYAFLNKISEHATEPLSVILQLELEKLARPTNVLTLRDARVSPPIAKGSTAIPASESLELPANVGRKRVSSGLTDVVVALSVGEKGDGSLLSFVAAGGEESAATPSGAELIVPETDYKWAWVVRPDAEAGTVTEVMADARAGLLLGGLREL
ncbi:hypothetical protein Tco_1301020 [Tanacetum coccineum]